MTVFWEVTLFCAGIVLIFKGGSFFVDAAGWLSDATGISKAVIGATVVSFATTSPEYVVSTIAVLKGYNDLSVGNAVGSLIANLGIAFALLAVLAPGNVHDKHYGAKCALMLAAALMLWLFCADGTISMAEGLMLLVPFALAILVNIKGAGKSSRGLREKPGFGEITLNSGKFVGGGGAIVLGSNLIVDNAQLLARRFGVSEAVIGLTVVAVGTSLPEIVTSVTAIVKKQNALSIGNIIGANIIDATLILSTGSFISGGTLAVSRETVTTDLPVLVLLMLLAMFPTALGKKIYRWQGLLLLTVYTAYILYITLPS